MVQMTQEVNLRGHCKYQANNARFLLECDFSKQYFHYYNKRLEKSRPFLEYNSRSRWGNNISIYKLVDLAVISSSITDASTNLASVTSPRSQDSQLSAKRIRRLSENSVSTPTPRASTLKVERVYQNGSPIGSPISPHGDPYQNLSPISPEVTNTKPRAVVVIGTIFKRMKLQPNVIEELSLGEHNLRYERYLGNYTSPDDQLILEDSDESILLTGNIDPKRFITGVVVALLGVPLDEGSQFSVMDICFAEPNRSLLYPDESIVSPILDSPGAIVNKSNLEPIFLMIVSSLGFHQDMAKKSALTKALQDLIDFIWGGGRFSEDKRSSQVSRILVAGNSLSEKRLQASGENLDENNDLAHKMKQSRQVKSYSDSIQALQNMDDFFSQLSKTIDIDVMPGPSDPASHLLPQQPFHPCMFPKSCIFPTFNCITNPHHATYNNIEMLATSGQNLSIVSKFSDLKDPIEIMKSHLMWGSSAPSAPDNLYSVPYENDDPYVIDFIPEVYIAGCQDEYRTDYYHYEANKCSQGSKRNGLSSSQAGSSGLESNGQCGIETKNSEVNQQTNWNDKKSQTLLVTIPKFDETLSFVLINLNTLEPQLVSLK